MGVLEFSGLNSRFQGLKFVWVVGYGPNEGDGEERDLERHGQDSG